MCISFPPLASMFLLVIAPPVTAQRATPIPAGGGMMIQVIEAGVGESVLSEDLAAYSVSEQILGRDENADGDILDDVVHVFDRKTETVHNLGWALSTSARPPLLLASGPHVLAWIGEAEQGGVDLNGDGDTLDAVLHWYDHRTTTATNVGLAGEGFFGFMMRGDLATFYVDETAQGADLNGDLDTMDVVLYIADFGRGRLINTMLCGFGPPPMFLENGMVIMPVHERLYGPGGIDLNRDGDDDDIVVVAYDPSTDRYSSPWLATSWLIHPVANGFVFTAPEEDEGRDLNGDGDMEDHVLHYFDTTTGQLTNLFLAGIWEFYGSYVSAGDRFAFGVEESEYEDADLNGDGDYLDRVWHVIDVNTGLVTNLELGDSTNTNFLLMNEQYFLLGVDEFWQGRQDLNGDGDILDTVLHSYSFATGLVRNHELALPAFSDITLEASMAAVPVSEWEAGTDLDGDGDLDGMILHLVNLSTGIAHNTALSIEPYSIKADHRGLVAAADEPTSATTDLNGDGDANDMVWFWLSWRDGRRIGTTWTTAGTGSSLLHGSFLFSVLEADQGNTDLNGDGDTNDRVICVGRMK